MMQKKSTRAQKEDWLGTGYYKILIYPYPPNLLKKSLKIINFYPAPSLSERSKGAGAKIYPNLFEIWEKGDVMKRHMKP